MLSLFDSFCYSCCLYFHVSHTSVSHPLFLGIRCRTRTVKPPHAQVRAPDESCYHLSHPNSHSHSTTTSSQSPTEQYHVWRFSVNFQNMTGKGVFALILVDAAALLHSSSRHYGTGARISRLWAVSARQSENVWVSVGKAIEALVRPSSNGRVALNIRRAFYQEHPSCRVLFMVLSGYFWCECYFGAIVC